MTLTRLLEIDRRFLLDVERRGLAFAENEYVRLGAPDRPDQLCAVLEQIIKTSVTDGVGYPRVLLLRKKQLQRGTWKPRRPDTARAPAESATVAPGENLGSAPTGIDAMAASLEKIARPGVRELPEAEEARRQVEKLMQKLGSAKP